MKKAVGLACALLLALAWGSAARAQEAPDWEIFAGYSFTRISTGGGDITLLDGTKIPLQQNFNGFETSVGENVNGWLGGIADIGAGWENPTIEGVRFNPSIYPFLFGPQFMWRKFDKFTLFARPMLGGAHARLTYASGGKPVYSQTAWAYSFGGGADVQLSDSIAVRVDSDYIRSHFAETLGRDFQDNFRVSIGLVFYIGSVAR
jgi:opacity protein-like surface antigen